MEVFFYGLFMDSDLLRGQGLNPEDARPGCVAGYRLKVGKRATLVREAGAIAWGIVISLPHRDAETLYSAPSVSDYRPEAVLVVDDCGHESAALCYNLPEFADQDTNLGYVRDLAIVAERMGLPDDYIAEIKAIGKPLV